MAFGSLASVASRQVDVDTLDACLHTTVPLGSLFVNVCSFFDTRLMSELVEK